MGTSLVLISRGVSQEKAITDADSIDEDRAAFVKRYLKLNWPERDLYDVMFNTEAGDSFVADILLQCIQSANARDETAVFKQGLHPCRSY